LKRISSIFILIIGLQTSGNAQVKHIANDVVKTVKFYPNPASSFINFEFGENYNDSYTLVIFNFIGKKVEDLKVADQKITVSLTNFYRGIYIFQLRDKQGNITESGKFQVIK
jgi:hypothetical protein